MNRLLVVTLTIAGLTLARTATAETPPPAETAPMAPAVVTELTPAPLADPAAARYLQDKAARETAEQEAKTKADELKKAADKVEKAKEQEEESAKGAGVNVPSSIGGWGLSAGLAAEFYSAPYVEEASINGTDKIVNIDSSYKTTPSFWAIGTYTTRCWTFLKYGPLCNNVYRPGFFFGVKAVGQSGTALDAITLGFQYTFIQTAQSSSEKKLGWMIGIGWVNHKVKHLAGDINEGKPLPAHYDDVKLNTRSDNSFLIMLAKNIF